MIELAALVAGFGAASFVVGMAGLRQTRGHGATPEVAEEQTADAPFSYRALEPLLSSVAGIVERISPHKRIDILSARIAYAGLEGALQIENVLTYKAGAALVGLLFGLAAGPAAVPRPVWAIAMGIAASFVPDLWLDSRAKARQSRLGRDLPEALDLLAITVEAGLGLEQALATVTDRLEGPLGAELHRVLREIELGVSRRDALVSLRRRTDVPEIAGFVAALVQADRVGAPIADVLRVQAGQVRMKRKQRAREKAAQTPVKILFPVIFFILPALFVVVMGPGAIRIMDTIFR